MPYSPEAWTVKREKGLGRYLLVDGILLTGGPFAVTMQIVGLFIYWYDYPSFAAYFTDTLTWTRFILHGVLFGLIIGYIKWRRNERAFAESLRSQDGV